MDTEYKEVKILTNGVNTPNIPKRINACGFDPEMWKKRYPGLTRDYFSNILEYCQEKNLDENKINKEVLDLAIEVAQQLNSTGRENYIRNLKKSYLLENTYRRTETGNFEHTTTKQKN